MSGDYALQDPLEPGDYRFVPPLDFVHRPAFGNATPFAIGSGTDFLPDPPLALTSSTYANSVNEARKLGQLNSELRSQDQTNLGDDVTFATQSTTALPSNPVRSFDRLTGAARECGESRIMTGFHYRFSVEVGASMGNEVAKKIVDTQLRRR